MKPVKTESRVTYGLEWYDTPEAADARGNDIDVVDAAHLQVHSPVDAGRAPLFDRHDHDTGALLYAVVVP
jgi:hypothetical protein